MKDRIKLVRQTLNMTQEEFAKTLKIKRNTIANYESGRNIPVDSVISLIVLTHNVNEHWLRTGEGEMFQELSREEEIADFAGRIINCDDESFKKRLISALTKFDDDDWNALERVLNKLMQG